MTGGYYLMPEKKDEMDYENDQDFDAKRTVKSLAGMLGWANIPPRQTLERSLSAERTKFKAEVKELCEKLAAAKEEIRNVVVKAQQIALNQPYFLDTNIGKRQEWVKQEIAEKIGKLLDPDAKYLCGKCGEYYRGRNEDHVKNDCRPMGHRRP